MAAMLCHPIGRDADLFPGNRSICIEGGLVNPKLCYTYKDVPEEEQLSDMPAEDDPRVAWASAVAWPKLRMEPVDLPAARQELKQHHRGYRPLKECPDSCNHRGICIDGRCNCANYWQGPSCNTTDPANCILSCSGAGECLGGWCRCHPGRWGEGCTRSRAFRSETGWRPNHAALKIYVYDIPENVLRPYGHAFSGPSSAGNYAAPDFFLAQLLADPSVRTENPWEAALFYVPAPVYRYASNLGSPRPVLARAVAWLRGQAGPWWNATRGRNHVFWLPGDRHSCDLDGEALALQHPIKVTHFGQSPRQPYSAFLGEPDLTPQHRYAGRAAKAGGAGGGDGEGGGAGHGTGGGRRHLLRLPSLPAMPGAAAASAEAADDRAEGAAKGGGEDAAARRVAAEAGADAVGGEEGEDGGGDGGGGGGGACREGRAGALLAAAALGTAHADEAVAALEAACRGGAVLRFRHIPGFDLMDMDRELEVCYRPDKDVMAPGHTPTVWMEPAAYDIVWNVTSGPGGERLVTRRADAPPRTIKMFFAGKDNRKSRYSQGVRQAVHAMYGNPGNYSTARGRYKDLKRPRVGPGQRPDFLVSWSVPQEDQIHHTHRAQFCLTPSGSGWGRRVTEAMAGGCVPVIVQDHTYQPLEDLLPYDEFALRLSRASLHALGRILDDVSAEQLAALQAGVERWHRALIWEPHLGGAAYSHTVRALRRRAHSLWAENFRRRQRRRRHHLRR